MVELEAPDGWERMKEEYQVMGLFPGGHIMANLRPCFKRGFICSKDIDKLANGASVTTAGLVIRRQRPQGKVVFITLEEEFGHIPLMVFPRVYEQNELRFKSPLIMVEGTLSRREGTHNVVVSWVRPLKAPEVVPPSKDWR